MKRRPSLLVGLLLAACASAPPVASAPSTLPTVPPTTPVTAPTPPAYQLQAPCPEAPPVDFSVLCDAARILATDYLEEVDPSGLAAAATLGVGEVTASAAPVDPPDSFRCTVPDAAFEAVCAAIAERASLASIADLAEGAVEGIFRYGLDPFSGYVPADLAARLAAHDAGRFDGIGVVAAALEGGVGEGTPCTPISERCRYLILTVLPATPAEEAGLSRGDAITAVDGLPLEGRSPSEVHALMEGDAGSEITLRLQRESRQLEVTLLRRAIEVLPVEWEAAGDILYVRLADFSQLGAQLLGRVLQTPEAEAASALILDLRDDPGGLVLSAVAVTSQFMPEGVAMRISDGTVEEAVPVIQGGLATRPELAVVVLVNRSSASAAEVVAAALQEAGRATVVGERTYGKDRVQQVYPVRGGAELWVTVARWSTAGGSSVGIYGVQPDVVVADQRSADRDPILEQALALVGS